MRRIVTAASLAALFFMLVTTGATRAQSVPVLAVDAIADGNTPRAIGAIDSCVGASRGEQVTIDVVVTEPGLGTVGLSGFEFRLYFDPQVVWVQAENPRMLLSQAPGSSLFPISSQVPNNVGEYLSAAVDFGKSGVEPAGSSEATGGVVSRITLKAKGNGESNLRLQRASLVNDNDGKVTPSIAEPARIVVGGKCAVATAAPTFAPTAPPGGTSTSASGGASSGSNGSQAAGVTGGGSAGESQSVPLPGDVPNGGGPPGSPGRALPLTILIGGMLAAAGLMVVGLSTFANARARAASPGRFKQ